MLQQAPGCQPAKDVAQEDSNLLLPGGDLGWGVAWPPQLLLKLEVVHTLPSAHFSVVVSYLWYELMHVSDVKRQGSCIESQAQQRQGAWIVWELLA